LKDISTHPFVRYHKYNGWHHRYFLKGLYYCRCIKLAMGRKTCACRSISGVFRVIACIFSDLECCLLMLSY